MNEFEPLKTLNVNVPEPSAQRLAPAYANLNQAIEAEQANLAKASSSTTKRGIHRPLVRWVMVAAAGLAVLTLVGGQIFGQSTPVQAAPVLNAAAASAAASGEPASESGQFLQITLHKTTQWGLQDHEGNITSGYDERLQILYMPANEEGEWAISAEFELPEGVDPAQPYTQHFSLQEVDEATAASIDEIAAVPTSSGKEALTYFDEQYDGGSNSRDEDNFIRITDLLRTGLVPAQTRAALYEALALIPGTVSIPDVTLPNGPTGVGIGRSEVSGTGIFTQIVIDPDTGALLGERSVDSDGELLSSTYFTHDVVDSSPYFTYFSDEPTP